MVIVKNMHSISSVNSFTGVNYFYSNIFYPTKKLVKMFVKNNKHHRYYGPATIYEGSFKNWIFNNDQYGTSTRNYSQKQFIKDLNKKWLL